MKRLILTVGCWAVLATTGMAVAQTPPLEGTPITRPSDLPHQQGYVARDEPVGALFNAVGSQMTLTSVVSAKALKKRVTGQFDLGQPRQVLTELSARMGLVWFSDGQTLYVYDASEVRNALGHMNHASVATLNDFLRKARLFDARYPVRGGQGTGTFYVAGPPVYVDLVINAARYLDELYQDADLRTEHIEVIHLEHSFVQGRRYGVRDERTLLPGVAETLQTMLQGEVNVRPPPVAPGTAEPLEPSAAPKRAPGSSDALLPQAVATAPPSRQAGATPVVVVPYPETNSLLVRGTLSQIQRVKNLVAAIDLPRQQIELSLWIIDIKRSELDKLGVQWTGEVGVAGRLGVGFNLGGAVSTLDGGRFLASVSALSSRGQASIVSRPVLLTQENIVAHFDSNSTFYAPLVGDHVSALESVTYGTLISVLPRLSATSEVEMQLRIEDGTTTGTGDVDGMPIVARTSIDTVARVPHNLSLLVGGYTRSSAERSHEGIPGLRRIPWVGGLFRHRDTLTDTVVRVFLVQPRVLPGDAAGEAVPINQHLGPEAAESLPQIYQRVRSALDSEAGHAQSP